MKIKEITDYLESFAPLALQESYDNSGLICGDKNKKVTSVLICLDSTEAVIDEAIAANCNLIVAHHPILFSGLKKITGKTYVERVIIKALQNNIAIYAAHTNLDNVLNGVNSKIAEKLGLINCSVLAPQKNSLKKLITYCPQDKADVVRNALFEAGAGNIGKYDKCSFNTSGTGSFRAGNDTNPYVGRKGKLHVENELKIETIYPAYLESKILKALFTSHPYEEIAFDLIPLTNSNNKVGSGLLGELNEEMTEIEFLKKLKKVMKTDCVRHTNLLKRKIKKVAVCGGSGSFLLTYAINEGADVFVTADFKYHQFFDTENAIIIADIGHYESEQFTIELFYDLLKKKFDTFAIQISKINTNPINYL